MSDETPSPPSPSPKPAKRKGGWQTWLVISLIALVLGTGITWLAGTGSDPANPNTASGPSGPAPIVKTRANCNGQADTITLALGQEIHNNSGCSGGYDVIRGAVEVLSQKGPPRTVGAGESSGAAPSNAVALVATKPNTIVRLVLNPYREVTVIEQRGVARMILICGGPFGPPC